MEVVLRVLDFSDNGRIFGEGATVALFSLTGAALGEDRLRVAGTGDETVNFSPQNGHVSVSANRFSADLVAESFTVDILERPHVQV